MAELSEWLGMERTTPAKILAVSDGWNPTAEPVRIVIVGDSSRARPAFASTVRTPPRNYPKTRRTIFN